MHLGGLEIASLSFDMVTGGSSKFLYGAAHRTQMVTTNTHKFPLKWEMGVSCCRSDTLRQIPDHSAGFRSIL